MKQFSGDARRSPLVLAVLAMMVLGPVTAGAGIYSATLEAESQALDLETEAVEPREPATVDSDVTDLHLAFNADRANPYVVFQNELTGVSIGFFDGVSFDYVDLAMLEEVTFTQDLIDQPFDANDTVVLVTPEDNVFKIGNMVDNGDGTVTFDVSDFN